jgi:hypothetical protein
VALVGIAVVAAMVVAVGFAVADRDDPSAESTSDPPQSAMGDMPTDAPQLPAVAGLYNDEQILFVHTESSDRDIADTLSTMMGSPVLVVPSLADVPDEALARVFVFTNGVTPEGPRGPLGFQRDVFDAVPGEEAYRPLRAVQLATWENDADPRELGSVDEIRDAITAGQVTVDEPGIVVNMPIIAWPGGTR